MFGWSTNCLTSVGSIVGCGDDCRNVGSTAVGFVVGFFVGLRVGLLVGLDVIGLVVGGNVVVVGLVVGGKVVVVGLVVGGNVVVVGLAVGLDVGDSVSNDVGGDV